MKSKDLVAVAVVALGTATLTVMTFWPGPMEAGGEGDANAVRFAKPKLVCGGAEISVAAKDGAILKAGDKPVFELTALNTTNQSVEVSVCVTMSALAPADKYSRTPRAPRTVWRCDQSLTLKPQETQTLTLPTGTALPANSVISVSLQEGAPSGKIAPAETLNRPPLLPGTFSRKPGIVAMSFSTAIPQAQPGLASAR